MDSVIISSNLLFLMIDVPQSPSTQISAGLTVSGLLDLCPEGPQHRAKSYKTHEFKTS